MLDYWTGEGIFYAIRSGQIAAPAAVDYLEGKTPDMTAYEKVVDDEIMPDLRIARTMTRIGLALPKLGFTMMKRSDRAWSLGCRVLRGDAAYYDIRGVWGPFKFMFDLAGRGI